MKRLLQITGVLSMAALTVAFCVLTSHINSVLDSWAKLPVQIDKLTSAVNSLPQQVVAPVLAEVNKQMDKTREAAVTALSTAGNQSIKQIDATRADLNSTIDKAFAQISGISASFTPVLIGAAQIEQHTDEILLHTDKIVTDLHPQLLGLVAASKVAAGQAATTLREIQVATPALLTNVQDATEHINAASAASAEASKNTALLTANLAAATKPLPKGIRLGLQVAGPLAQIASYVILMLSTLGAL